MLGLNHSVRNTPVSNRMTKLHSAISPSMKDQWSGKTLRICFLVAVARPSRSSAHVAAPAALLGLLVVAGLVPLVEVVVLIGSPTFPVARADRFGEALSGDQVALGVDHQRQLRQVSAGRTEDDLAVVGEVEGRLVAGAQQVVRLLLPQGDRTTDVRADLGEAEDALDAPVLAALPGLDVVGVHPDQDHRSLGLLLEQLGALVLGFTLGVVLEEDVRLGVDELADLHVLRTDLGAVDVLDDAHALLPDRVRELVTRQG